VNNTVYRIIKTKWVSSAFDGEGARKYPGRWNNRGTSMIYAASSEALATLEILVHYESEQLIRDYFVIVPLGGCPRIGVKKPVHQIIHQETGSNIT
jgi:RES domain-containing protein